MSRVVEDIVGDPINIENEIFDDQIQSYIDEQENLENENNNERNDVENDGDRADCVGEKNGDEGNDDAEVDEENENENILERKKRKKTSKVWDEFKEVILPDGQRKGECYHCKKKLALGTTGATTQFKRHLERCASRIRTLKKQKILQFQSKDSEDGVEQSNEDHVVLSTFKYDHSKVRDMIAHYILINEKPFSVVEEFGFNLVLKSMSPFFSKYSRATARKDVFAVYEKEKRKLKNLLKNVGRVSFTRDLWKFYNRLSTVASESTFSAGERVVDTYRSKLGIEIVQALICGSNWARCHYGLKGRVKEEEDDEEMEIPLPIS